MRPILLAVDLSYQVYRATCAHPLLKDSEGTFTGGLFGFLKTLGKQVRETGATRAVFCRDVKPYLRSFDYPEYKQLRGKKAEDPEVRERYAASMAQVLGVLEGLGHLPWGLPGFESDDLIGHVVRRHRGRFGRVYASSNDSDLWQLLDAPNFAIFVKDEGDVVDASTLAARGLTPAEHMLMTAMTGTHNDVAGIPNVGPVTALKALRDPSVMRKLRAEHGDLIDRNLDLIRLPHARFPAGEPLPQAPDSFDARALYRMLARYEIDSTAAMLAAFEQLARGTR